MSITINSNRVKKGLVNKFFQSRLKKFSIRSFVFLVGVFILIGFGSTVFSANYPFPQSVTYSNGIKPDNYSQSQMNQDVQTVFTNWRNDYLVSAANVSATAKRVQRPGNNHDTVSEGIGYGMLILVYMDSTNNNTQSDFNGLLEYYKYYHDANGLMNWQINSDGSVAGQNAATDADEDVALALLMADKQWGSGGSVNYLSEATTVINNLMANCVESSTYVLKPGDVWGGSDNLNPSYWAPGWYRLFYEATGDSHWLDVINELYNHTMRYFYNNYTTGLVPDWCKADGSDSGKGYDYTYDACRTPWRIGVDYLWNGTLGSGLAYSNTKRMADWIHSKTGGDASQIGDGYKLDGTSTGGNNNSPFVGPFTVSAMMDSSSQTWLNNLYARLRNFQDGSYYNDSLQVLTMLGVTGNFPILGTITNTNTIQPQASPTNVCVIDTFEDDDLLQNTYAKDSVDGMWIAVDDAAYPNNGNSVGHRKQTNDASEGINAMYFEYTLGADFVYRFAILQDDYGFPMDFSEYSHIVFSIKGSGKQMTLVLPATNIHDFDYYEYKITSTPSTWTTYTLAFSDFAQEGWGASKSLDLHALMGFQFKASSQNNGEHGWFMVDNVKVLSSSNVLPPSPLAAPPVPSVLDTFEDDNIAANSYAEDSCMGYWLTVNDKAYPNSGDSVGKRKQTNDAYAGSKSLYFKYTLGSAFSNRFAELIDNFGNVNPRDFSQYSNIIFSIKGSGHKMSVVLDTTNIHDSDSYEYTIPATPSTWTTYTLWFSDFAQEGWGASKPLNLDMIKAIQFKASSKVSGENGWFMIDNVSLGTQPNPNAPPSSFPFSNVIETFEDDNIVANTYAKDSVGGMWISVDDSAYPNNGNSVAHRKQTNDASEGTKAMYFKYTLGADFNYRFATLQDDYGFPVDFSDHGAITFSIKGSGHEMTLVLPATNIHDFDYYEYKITSTPSTWTTYTLAFSDFAQEGWGASKSLDLHALTGFQFKASSQNNGEQGWFIIDNVKVLSTNAVPAPSPLVAPSVSSVLDTFEDDDIANNTYAEDTCMGYWLSINDKAYPNSGDSVGKRKQTNDAYAGSKSLYFKYTLGSAFSNRFAELIDNYGNVSPRDFSAYSTIIFSIKGSGHKMSVVLDTTNIHDSDSYEYTIPATPSTWTTYTLWFSDFKQEGWGASKPLNLDMIKAIQFKASSKVSGENGWFMIDNVTVGTQTKPSLSLPFSNVIDTFEDDDIAANTYAQDSVGGMWISVNDTAYPNNGNSVGHRKQTNDTAEGTNAMYFEYTLGADFQFRFATLQDDYGFPVDFSDYGAITFSIKGSGNEMTLVLPATNIHDSDYYEYKITATPSTWTTYTLAFSDFAQEGWGASKSLDLHALIGFQFKASSQNNGEHGWFMVDNVKALSSSNVLPPSPLTAPSVSNVIDTFEDDDIAANSYAEDTCMGYWLSINDGAYPNSGNSVGHRWLTNDTAEGTNAMYFKYTLGADFSYRFAELIDNFGNVSPRDFSQYSNIIFSIKGSSNEMTVVLQATNIHDSDYYGYKIVATPSTWTTYTLAFSDFQPGWPTSKPLDLSALTGIQFNASSQNDGEQGWFIIDNVKVGRPTFSAPVISSLTATEDTNGSGNVLISYTGTDAENDTCTYVVSEYSTNNSTWHVMTANTADPRHSGTLNFTSTGAALNFVWDSATDLSGVYDGSVWVRLQVNDGTSNSAIVSNGSFVVDNDNPTTPSLSTPASNSAKNNTSVTFTWNASTDGSGIDHYVIEVSTNSAFGNIEATASPSGTSQTFTLTEGTNYWRVRAYDAYGHVSANSIAWPLTIDTNQVIPILGSPTNNTLSSVAKPTFYWSSESGISSNQIVITTNGVAINITLSSNETNYSVTNFALPEGTNSWKVRVKTSTGWQAFSPISTYIVDTTAPTNVPSISIENGATTTTNKEVTITLYTTGLDSDVVGYYISEENTPPSTNSGWNMGSIPTNVVFPLSSGEGTKTVSIWVIDSAGNISAPRSASITYKIATSGVPNNTFTITPNPLFQNETMDITYGAKSDDVKFEVYTMVGSLVATITPNSTTTAHWYGKNSDGKEVASGIYLMIMRVDGKMVYKPIKVGYIGRHK